jgi:16S rRNA processing protein RimM
MQPRRERTAKSSSRSSRSSASQPKPLVRERVTKKQPPVGGSSSFVRIATVARAHGLRGHVVVDIDATIAAVVVPGLRVRFEKEPQPAWDSEITSVRTNGRRMVWGVASLEDRSAAEAWAGAAVSVTKAELPATGEHEYFDFELLGAEVFAADGTPLGIIHEVVATGANDVLVARGPRGEILIPLTRHAVVEVDRIARRIIVDARALVYEDGREGP